MKISFKTDYRGFKKGQEFTFPDKGAIVLVGDNGCGKSTLAWLISELSSEKESRLGAKSKAGDIAIVDTDGRSFHQFNTDQGNIRHLSYLLEDTMFQVQTMHCSKGEAVLMQFAKFIGEHRGQGHWVILDEPDSGVSPYQAGLLAGVLPQTAKFFGIFHNPILIAGFDRVFALSREDGVVSMTETSGPAFLQDQKDQAEKIRALWEAQRHG